MFLAFNKTIADYAKTKLSGYHNIDCRTFHSFGSILVSKATGFFADMDQKALGTSKLRTSMPSRSSTTGCGVGASSTGNSSLARWSSRLASLG
jgi:hypothetical protein